MNLKKDWPEGSKERFLLRDFPGCKTLAEALKEETLKRQDSLNPKSSLTTEEIMTRATALLKTASEGFDYKSMSLEDEAKMAAMPITTVDEINAWTKAWLTIFKKK